MIVSEWRREMSRSNFDRNWNWIGKFRTVIVGAVLVALLPARPALAQQNVGPQMFDSPDAAAKAFFNAAQSGSDQELLKVLGMEGKEVITTGDTVEDFDSRTGFVLKYEEMHRLSKRRNGSVVLVVGAENWPLPLPIVQRDGKWMFDVKAGKTEILYRRIGENEISAIQACDELVQAQKDYFAGAGKQYAQKIFSDKDKNDGLYSLSPDDPANATDEAIAHASGTSQGNASGTRVPYNGYYFRVVTQQGPQASGGAKNYIVDGKMTGGFAFVAYPAEYRSSGVMTFIVNADGVVYEKDLGKETSKEASAIAAYNPDSTWKKVE
jgi:DUF2950 family protein